MLSSNHPFSCAVAASFSLYYLSDHCLSRSLDLRRSVTPGGSSHLVSNPQIISHGFRPLGEQPLGDLLTSVSSRGTLQGAHMFWNNNVNQPKPTKAVNFSEATKSDTEQNQPIQRWNNQPTKTTNKNAHNCGLVSMMQQINAALYIVILDKNPPKPIKQIKPSITDLNKTNHLIIHPLDSLKFFPVLFVVASTTWIEEGSMRDPFRGTTYHVRKGVGQSPSSHWRMQRDTQTLVSLVHLPPAGIWSPMCGCSPLLCCKTLSGIQIEESELWVLPYLLISAWNKKMHRSACVVFSQFWFLNSCWSWRSG